MINCNIDSRTDSALVHGAGRILNVLNGETHGATSDVEAVIRAKEAFLMGILCWGLFVVSIWCRVKNKTGEYCSSIPRDPGGSVLDSNSRLNGMVSSGTTGKLDMTLRSTVESLQVRHPKLFQENIIPEQASPAVVPTPWEDNGNT